jgi:hypothetical protein
VVTVSRSVPLPPGEILGKLKMILAAANCRVLSAGDDGVRFRHGTYLTQSAPLLPKECTLTFHPEGPSTRIDGDIRVAGPARIWLIFVAVVLCWAIFPPILVYRALVWHPRQFVENLLAGL